MSEFLDTLKKRSADAQARVTVTQQKLQQAQVEYQAAAQEFAGWQQAIAAETKRETQPRQGPPGPPQNAPPPVAAPAGAAQPPEQVNKTEAVRAALRRHPMGIEPSDLWAELQSSLGNKAYMYSVLKRLKDSEEAAVRRGKYVLKLAPQKAEN